MNRRPVLAALASLAVAPLSLPVLAQSYRLLPSFLNGVPTSPQ